MIKEDTPTVNIGSGHIPGAGPEVAAAGKPANFGDAIVSSGAAKEWKKQNKMFRRKAPMAEEQIDELSRDTLLSYANKVSLDSQKHSKDPTKRSGEKASRSVTGYARAHNRLEKPVKEEQEMQEGFINGREYASQGVMHPDHAKNHKVGAAMDFYGHGTGDKLSGNAHFFAGDMDVLKRFLDIGFTVSFTGVITFTHDYDELIRYTPLESLHAETDAPFVAPVPHRGSRNSPEYVPQVVSAIAQIKGENEEKVKKTLISNARRVFKLA